MNTQTLPIWLEYFKAIGPVAVTVIAAFVASFFAYRQWRTAQDKIVLDLFEKRLASYHSLIDIFTDYVTQNSGRTEKQAIKEFRSAKERSQFIFGAEVNEFLDDIHSNMWKISAMIRSGKDLEGPARDSNFENMQKIDIGVTDFIMQLTKLVRPYMSLEHKIR